MPTIFEHDALPPGSRLGEFEVQRVLGIGGFGIVYLAFDHALEREVAIKEYMPAALASRGQGSEVVVRSVASSDTFTLGLRSFIHEARLLARFNHASLVKVYRFWEQHGTAYMVMPYYRGLTLHHVRRDMAGPPDEAWLRRLIMPLLGALECLHRENVFHRDVAPDNILLLEGEDGPGSGEPVLLDLGAARRVIGDHTQTLTAIVKPSFAPIEQYAETAQLRQGPWTDIYALAAVVHFCITGRPPTPATARVVHDELTTLRQMRCALAKGFDREFSEGFVNAVDHALSVKPQDRPASIPAWRAELNAVVSRPVDLPQGLFRHDDALNDPPDANEAGEDWVPHTVLVRRPSAEPPPGHVAMDAAAFMTTVPAAGRLLHPLTWPVGKSPKAQSEDDQGAAPAGRGDGPVADSAAEDAQPPVRMLPDSMPVTMPVPRRDATALGGSGTPPRPAAVRIHARGADRSGSRAWLGWSAVSLLGMAVLASWWSFHRHHDALPAAQWVATTSLNDRASQRPVLPLAGVPPNTSEARAGVTPAVSKPSVDVPLTDPQAILPALAANLPGSSPAVIEEIQKTPPAAGPALVDEPASKTKAGRHRAHGDRSGHKRHTSLASEGALNPRKACGGRNFIMAAICMKDRCAQAAYARHPECERMRQQEASAQRGNFP